MAPAWQRSLAWLAQWLSRRPGSKWRLILAGGLGAPADEAALSVPIFDAVLSGKSVIGSIIGSRNDLADVFALHGAGRTKIIAVNRKLGEVNGAVNAVLSGRIDGPGRLPVLTVGRLTSGW